LQFVLARLTSVTAGLPYIGALKYLLTRSGLPGGAPRAPQRALTTGEVDLIDRRLEAEADVRAWLEAPLSPSRGLETERRPVPD
jgi:hypothetical protein